MLAKGSFQQQRRERCREDEWNRDGADAQILEHGHVDTASAHDGEPQDRGKRSNGDERRADVHADQGRLHETDELRACTGLGRDDNRTSRPTAEEHYADDLV
jgi:hypothetical protein